MKRVKKEKRKQILGGIIFLILIIIISFILSKSIKIQSKNHSQEYSLEDYTTLDKDYENILEIEENSIKNINDPGELYWDHMPLSYRFNETNEFVSSCQSHIKLRIKDAFEEIQRVTNNSVTFKEVDSNEDITIFCYNKIKTEGKASLGISTAGEGGPILIQGNKMLKGELNFYPYQNCGTYPDVELHEILHVLGFEHNESSRISLMYPYRMKCDGEFDEYIKEKLMLIYS